MNRTALLLVSILSALPVHAQGVPHLRPDAFPPDIGPATLTVAGLGGKSIQLTMTEIGAIPRRTIRTTDHGAPVSFEGVLLKDVLAKVDLPLGEQFHKTAASYYVVVEAADGYRAVFAWAELDASFMDKPVYLVTHRDGKPLSSSDGPFEVIAPGEKRGARWVKQVTALSLRQAS